MKEIDGNMPSSQKILLDKFTEFLKPSLPTGQHDYYNPRIPLISKELSVGFIAREDMISYLMTASTILELLEEGQIDLARFAMTMYINEWKSSMSIDGAFLREMMANKIEYSTSQTLHEYQHKAPKKGIFVKAEPNSEQQGGKR